MEIKDNEQFNSEINLIEELKYTKIKESNALQNIVVQYSDNEFEIDFDFIISAGNRNIKFIVINSKNMDIIEVKKYVHVFIANFEWNRSVKLRDFLKK
jgi:hypothetical protein